LAISTHLCIFLPTRISLTCGLACIFDFSEKTSARPRAGRARMLRFLPATFVAPETGCRMTPETQQSESPYCVRIETETGQSSTVPIAVLTPKQLEVFLQSEFKRLAQEAGVKGARIHVERAIAADYEQVLREVAACLFSAKARAA
jgi:hypothetical protein